MVGHTGVLLFSAAAGYWVLERADHNKGNLKRVGQAVGWFIILASILGIVCKVYCASRAYCESGSKMCPFSAKGGMSSPMPAR